MKKHIPNFITSLNLLCGMIALFFVFQDNMTAAAIFVFLGIFFDFFDGFFARLLNVTSKVGLEFDSLADVVTSGVVPGAVMMQLISKSIFGVPFSVDLFETADWNNSLSLYLPFVGLFIGIAAAYRLAKFNVDDRQTDSFIGMPTPAVSIWVLSLPLILNFQSTVFVEDLLYNIYFLLIFTFFVSILMNIELPLLALKFKNWTWTNNRFRYIFLGISVLAILSLKFIGISVLLLSYILLSVIDNKMNRNLEV